MIKSQKFTTSFPADFIKELERISKDMMLPKNDILMHAFMFWSKRKKQSLLAESYKKATLDTEWVALGEVGLSDWNNQILKWEK